MVVSCEILFFVFSFIVGSPDLHAFTTFCVFLPPLRVFVVLRIFALSPRLDRHITPALLCIFAVSPRFHCRTNALLGLAARPAIWTYYLNR